MLKLIKITPQTNKLYYKAFLEFEKSIKFSAVIIATASEIAKTRILNPNSIPTLLRTKHNPK